MRRGPGRARERPAWASSLLPLRRRITLIFALGATAVSTLLAAGTYVAVRYFVIEQREEASLKSAFARAVLVREGLLSPGADVSDVLSGMNSPPVADTIVRAGGEWYSTSLDRSGEDIPAALRTRVEQDGDAAVAWTRAGGVPAVVVGVPIPSVGAQLYEIEQAVELDRTLQRLRSVLLALAVTTSAAGALVGRAAADRAVSPLDDVASAAARIAAGDLSARLAPTDDPDLVTIVGSFNAMLETLKERLDRDARFAADVSHELRSPLTTLITAVSVLESRRHELSPRDRAALDLVSRELERFRQSLDDLLALARLDADPTGKARPVQSTDLAELVEHTLEGSGRPSSLLRRPDAAVLVDCDRRYLQRALRNLFDNADLHGGGLSAVVVERQGEHALVMVDDDGPGVPAADRERVFERFARAGSRAAHKGTGLGLSLVAETTRRLGGRVWCTDRPGTGGARFVVQLPLARAGLTTLEPVHRDEVAGSR